jgi:hypothetical protein
MFLRRSARRTPKVQAVAAPAAEVQSLVYDTSQFDLQRFLTRTIEDDERKLQDALANLKRSDLNFEGRTVQPRRLARA